MGYISKQGIISRGISNSLDTKKCSTFSSNREIQIKMTPRFHLIPDKWLSSKLQVTAQAGEDVELEGTLLHCLWGCKLVQPLWKSIWWFLRKWVSVYFEIQLYHCWAYNQSMFHHTSKTLAQLCSQIKLKYATLFIIARNWK